jgi:Txe/YoeB family toxin of Txe-Axe toxin-antitoxin module
MKFFFLFLFYYKNYNNLALFSKNLNTYKKTLGNDERQTKNITEEINEISKNNYKIYKYLEKKKLLDILKNNSINTNNKLKLLEVNNNYATNLKAGGLIDDFSL